MKKSKAHDKTEIEFTMGHPDKKRPQINPASRIKLAPNISLNAETIQKVHQFLSKNELGLLSVQPGIIKHINPSLSKPGYKPCCIPSVENMVVNFILAKNPDNKILTELVDVVYIGADGMLQTLRCGAESAEKTIQDHGLFFSKFDKLDENLAEKHYPATILRQKLKTPDKIGNTVISANIMKHILHSLQNSKCFDESARIDPHLAYGIGNNVTQLDMTVRDYVLAVYNLQLLRWLDEKGPTNAIVAIPPAFQQIYSELGVPKNASNWDCEMLPCDASMPFNQPDPDAYAVLTKLNNPILERSSENKQKGTFDFVRIYLGIKSKTAFPSRFEFIRKHKTDFVKIALLKIASYKKFAHMGVPIQYLKPASLIITAHNEIELLFELKSISS